MLDKSTVAEVINDLEERFGFTRIIFVGDLGMLSDDNQDFILREKLDFIACHRFRKNNVIVKFVTDTHDELDHDPNAKEQYLEDERGQVKFVMAYDPAMASTVKEQREEVP